MTHVMMETSAGNIKINLFTDEAPETTGNFLKLVDSREIPHILALWGGRGTQKHPQNLTFNKGIHPGGAKGQPLHQKWSV